MADRDRKIDELDPDAPPSAEEALASSRLRDALEDPSLENADAELARSLLAAWSPGAIGAEDHAELIESTPTAEELALAEELRELLDGGGGGPAPHPDAELLGAVRAAWSPSAIPDEEHRAIVARATAPSGAEIVPLRPRGRSVGVAIAVTGVLALAASVFLYVGSAPPSERAPLARARSTQPLFGEPFRAGESSARIDRIAMARASDYRDNRFAKWGVR